MAARWARNARSNRVSAAMRRRDAVTSWGFGGFAAAGELTISAAITPAPSISHLNALTPLTRPLHSGRARRSLCQPTVRRKHRSRAVLLVGGEVLGSDLVEEVLELLDDLFGVL